MNKKYGSLCCVVTTVLSIFPLIADAAPQARRLGYVDNTSAATTVAFSPDGKTLANGIIYLHTKASKTTELGAIRLWDVTTGKQKRVLRPFGIVHSVAFSPDGKMLAAGLELGTGHKLRGQVNVWNIKTWKLTARLKVPQAHVYSIAFTPNGKLIAAGCGDIRVRLWDWKRNKVARTLTGSGSVLSSLAISPNGRYIAAGSRYVGSNAVLWEISTGRTLHTWQHQGAVAFSPDSKTVASCDDERNTEPNPSVNLWSVATGKLQKTLPSRNSESADSLAFSPNGKFLAVNAGGGVGQVWDLSQSKVKQNFKTTSSGEIKFSADGKLIAEAGYGSAIYLHQVNTK